MTLKKSILLLLCVTMVFSGMVIPGRFVAKASPISPTDVYSLAINPANASKVFAGTSDGIFCSTDGGSTWSHPNNLLRGKRIDHLVSTPAAAYAVVNNSDIYRSTDDGATWTQVFTSSYSYPSLVADPHTPTTLYMSNSNGVYKSTDSGDNWGQISTAVTYGILAIDTGATPVLYAGSQADSNMYKSVDSGVTWTLIQSNTGSPWESAGLYLCSLVIDPVTPTTVYVGTMGSGVAKSTDGGTTWFAMGSGLDDANVATLTIDPNNTSTLYVGTNQGGVFKSINGGTSWAAANGSLSDLSIRDIRVDPAGIVYIATQTSWYRSTDGGTTWTIALAPRTTRDITINYTNGTITSPAVTPIDNGDGTYTAVIAVNIGSNQTVSFAPNPGSVWNTESTVDSKRLFECSSYTFNNITDDHTIELLYRGDAGANTTYPWTLLNDNMSASGITFYGTVIDPVTPTTVYQLNSGGIFKSTDSGAHWTSNISKLFTGLGSLDTTSGVSAFAVDPTNTQIMYAGPKGFYGYNLSKTTDGGTTWNTLATGNVTGTSTNSWQAILIDPAIPANVYAISGSYFFKSTNSGSTWTKTTCPPDSSNGFTSLAMDPTTHSTLYAGTWKGLYKSTNSGGTWVLSSGLSGMSVEKVSCSIGTTVYTSISVTVQNPDTSYVNHKDIYKTTDGGTNWTLIRTGVTVNPPDNGAVVVDPTDPSVVYASDTLGVYESTDGGSTWVDHGLNEEGACSLTMKPGDNTTIYAASNNPKWHSIGVPGIFISKAITSYHEVKVLDYWDTNSVLSSTSIAHGAGHTEQFTAPEGNYLVTESSSLDDAHPFDPGASFTFDTVTVDHTFIIDYELITISVNVTNGTFETTGATYLDSYSSTKYYTPDIVGGDCTFTFTPDEGYVWSSGKVNGSATSSAITSYTFHNVTGSQTIEVNYLPLADMKYKGIQLTNFTTNYAFFPYFAYDSNTTNVLSSLTPNSASVATGVAFPSIKGDGSGLRMADYGSMIKMPKDGSTNKVAFVKENVDETTFASTYVISLFDWDAAKGMPTTSTPNSTITINNPFPVSTKIKSDIAAAQAAGQCLAFSAQITYQTSTLESMKYVGDKWIAVQWRWTDSTPTTPGKSETYAVVYNADGSYNSSYNLGSTRGFNRLQVPNLDVWYMYGQWEMRLTALGLDTKTMTYQVSSASDFSDTIASGTVDAIHTPVQNDDVMNQCIRQQVSDDSVNGGDGILIPGTTGYLRIGSYDYSGTFSGWSSTITLDNTNPSATECYNDYNSFIAAGEPNYGSTMLWVNATFLENGCVASSDRLWTVVRKETTTFGSGEIVEYYPISISSTGAVSHTAIFTTTDLYNDGFTNISLYANDTMSGDNGISYVIGYYDATNWINTQDYYATLGGPAINIGGPGEYSYNGGNSILCNLLGDVSIVTTDGNALSYCLAGESTWHQIMNTPMSFGEARIMPDQWNNSVYFVVYSTSGGTPLLSIDTKIPQLLTRSVSEQAETDTPKGVINPMPSVPSGSYALGYIVLNGSGTSYTLTPHRVTPGGTVVNMDIPVPINPGDTVRVQYKPSPEYVISEPIGVVGSVTGVDQTHYSHYDWTTGFWYIDVVIPSDNAQNYDINVQFDGDGTTTPPAGYFHITASSTGNGTVTPVDEYVKAGSTVYLNVTPNGTDTLQSFTDNGTAQIGVGSTYTITNVQEDHAIVAAFSGASLVTLTVPITGNGTVTVSPSGTVLGLNTYAFVSGTTVSLTPIPDGSATFTQWNTDASGSTTPLSVTLSTSKTVGAEFSGGTLCTVTLTIATTADILPGVAPSGAFGTGSVSGASFPMADVPMNSLVNIPLTAGNSDCYLYALVVNGVPVLPVYGRNGENVSLSAMSTTPIRVNNANTTIVAYFQNIGDLNLDGKVGILDLNIICTFSFDAGKPYVQHEPFVNRHSSQDINHDGVVDLVDASLLLAQYGKVT